jgi:hypothetical protein
VAQGTVKISMPRIKHFFINVAVGLQSKFPPCCILNFSFNELIYGNAVQKRHVRGLGHGGYVPCKLCSMAKKQTYRRAVTELFLDTGYLEDCDYPLLPDKVKALVI